MSFGESLATKCFSLNDDPRMIRPTLIDLNLAEPKYYPFLVSLDKLLEVFLSYLQRYMFQKKQKTLMLNGVKTMTKHISCDFKCKFNSKT